MYKMIVFDLDGTLLDTLGDLTNAVNAALKAYGYPLRTKEEVRSFVGDGVVKLLERASGETGERCKPMISYFQSYYREHCKEETKPYEGILPLIRVLKKQGKILAVVSNKPDYAVKLLAEEYFLGMMQAAVGENEPSVRKKPAPDSLFTVMEENGVAAEETLYVGDSEVDIQTAKNAGVKCVSVVWGFKDEDFLKENGATDLIFQPLQLLELV